MSTQENMLFKCPQCGWWASGIHIAEQPLSAEELSKAVFDVECQTPGCIWKAQLPGEDGTPLAKRQPAK